MKTFKKSILVLFILEVLFCCFVAANAQAPTDSVKTSVKAKSVQCSATTKKGERCKHMTKNVSGKCFQHQK